MLIKNYSFGQQFLPFKTLDPSYQDCLVEYNMLIYLVQLKKNVK